MQRPLVRRLIGTVLNLFAPPVGHYFLGATRIGVALLALLVLSLGWLVYSHYSGGDTPRLQVAIGLVVASELALLIHPWFVRLGEPPRLWRVALGTAVVMVIWPSSLRENWLEAFQIPGASMYPSLEEGDHFFALKRPWAPQRGEIAVYRGPDGQPYVKRVIALAGDRVAVSTAGTVSVNGERLPTKRSEEACLLETYSGNLPCERHWETLGAVTYEISRSSTSSASAYPETLVPPGTVFVLGDNRENSFDSRQAGPVPIERLVGRAGPVVWWR